MRDGVLIVGEAGGILAKLAELGIRAAPAPRVSDDALERVGIVAFAGAPGTPLPHDAVTAAAAGCLVVVPRPEPAHGFVPGADLLVHGNEDECVLAVARAVAFPGAYAAIAASGRITARAVARAPHAPPAPAR